MALATSSLKFGSDVTSPRSTNPSFSIFNKPLETSVAISSSGSGEAATSSAKAKVVPSTLLELSPTELLNFSMSLSTLDTKLGSAIIFFKCSLAFHHPAISK
ncbi:hypothetical protein ES288_A01G011700v1 [Gossypium darwinii]|uniref:Uncharacterized protein n=2 Tax=Gossypium TaxID=3633 RepID=A0A5D2RP77_GOSTO|nr:hypothetical protein ES288_A01G011700v1 [Gossypium darwinii]TYI41314.1 hypothetical protein ES332_A01G011200v1 [Gossypium tomentosum]